MSESWGVREGRILWFLNNMESISRSLYWATDRRIRRQSLIRAIAQHAEGGKVAVIESGMDCDGSQYSGYRHLIDANVRAFDSLRRRLGESADGPFYLDIAAPSEDVEYSSRDLALEAFENGHPYSLRSGV